MYTLGVENSILTRIQLQVENKKYLFLDLIIQIDIALEGLYSSFLGTLAACRDRIDCFTCLFKIKFRAKRKNFLKPRTITPGSIKNIISDTFVNNNILGFSHKIKFMLKHAIIKNLRIYAYWIRYSPLYGWNIAGTA